LAEDFLAGHPQVILLGGFGSLWATRKHLAPEHRCLLIQDHVSIYANAVGGLLERQVCVSLSLLMLIIFSMWGGGAHYHHDEKIGAAIRPHSYQS
jgi:hypothetical protein